MPAPLSEFNREVRTLTPLPAPSHRNSAGRLLVLLHALAGENPRQPYYGTTAQLFGGNSNKTGKQKFSCFLAYMRILTDTWSEFTSDLEACSTIPEPTKAKILKGLSNLDAIIFPEPGSVPGAPRQLTEAERSLLDVAASLMPEEGSMSSEDRKAVRDAIEAFRNSVEADAGLPKSVKQALLEIALLASNALEQFNIFGARGFKEAYKRMIVELWELRCTDNEAKNQPWYRKATLLIDVLGKAVAKYEEIKPLIEAGTTWCLGNS